MGRYSQIRGWIEASDAILPAIQGVIASVPTVHASSACDAESIALYQSGWHVGPIINWTRYVFFGADVRSQYVHVYRSTIDAIARVKHKDGDHPDGVFYVDDEEGDSVCWRIAEGTVTVTPRDVA
jgi:hypothetical protein